jgi:signal transduction histidine kinase/HPt (histidine-containing phosphotransfer) domain-containing protein
MSRILIVEDSPTQACKLAIVLEEAGFEAETAPDAERAFDRLARERFDLVLSDLNLPGGSGFDLCRRVRAHPALRALPVVVHTSQADPVNVLRGLEAGADGFMTKDREPAEIVGRIRRVLARAGRAGGEAAPPRVAFLGREFELSAGRDQLLDVLVSAFEDVVHLNQRYKDEIAQRRRAEAELLKAREAADAANRAKSDFLARMSHEIRTPMNGVLGMTELVLETPLTAQQHDYLSMVKSSADALLTVINDILDFSKVEAGKLELDAIDFSLRECLGDTLRLLTFRAAQKGLALTGHIAPDVPDDLVGDPGRLRQVIINLVGNALKFTERGEVAVSVSLVPGPTSPAEDKGQGTRDKGQGTVALRFAVRDTGIGIPKEKHGLLFRSFSQADTSTARKYGGTGLGLAISARLVELMGGRIGIDSEVGRGSTFHFTATFGRSRGPKAARPAAGPPPVSRRPLRVLLADDNPINQQVATRMLEKAGHVAVVAGSGKEALAALERQPFDLVLMDVEMPEMSGFEATAVVREREKGTGRHVPIIAMTAHALKGDREKCLAAGMDGYVAKPIQAHELLRAIAGVVPADAPAEAAAPERRPADEVLDRAAAVQCVGGDRRLLGEIVRLFAGQCPRWVADIRDAVARGDANRLRQAAHALKGAVGNFGARAAFAEAQRLEWMGRDGDLAAAAGACADLEKQLERLLPALAALADEAPPQAP